MNEEEVHLAVRDEHKKMIAALGLLVMACRTSPSNLYCSTQGW